MKKKGATKIRPREDQRWYSHYYKYLTQLTYQLFEWEGLPESIDPRYLEMSLHQFGYVGFYYDKKVGFVVTQGALGGNVDRYYRPTRFHGVSSQFTHNFEIYNYADEKKDGMGVVIYNNDYDTPTTPSLKLFAEDLAEVKNVTNVNINAQKTPVLITADDNTRLSLVKMYEQYEGNEPVIIGHEDGALPDSIRVLKTDAPFHADKLTQHRNAIWNEVMTYLGIKNANLEKKERMISDEANSNNEQIEASTNIWLKSRLEACDRIKELFDLELNVKMRTDTIKHFQNELKEVNSGGLQYGNNTELYREF